MKKLITYIILTICPFLLHAQLSNNGALISVKSGAMMSVHEEVVNYNGGEFHNTDTIYAFYDWTNNAGNEAFISNGVGIVHLYGADQRIKGTDITRFYDLRLEQTGVKYGDLDVYVDGFLRLNDRRFHLDTNTVSVFNPDIDAVENIGDGYVSAIEAGGLLRHLDKNLSYFYPVGWPNYYRPLELTPFSSTLNIMKVRMAFADATIENFDRGLREPTLCEVNPTYYHRIYQEAGNDSIKIKLHYDEAVDGEWNTIAHFQNVPQWEDTGLEVSGVDPVTGLDFHETFNYISNFVYPAFALGDSSDTIPLVASDTIICEGETVTFTVETGFIFYEFFVNDISVQAGTSNIYITNNLADGDVVTFSATANECMYNGSEIVMTVHPLPIASASSNTPVCENSDLELSSNGGLDYNWSGPNNFMSTDQNPIISDVTLNAEGTYFVTVTDINGCSDTTTTDVVIFPAPIVDISSNSPICDGDDLNLMASGGLDYAWEGPNSFTSNDQNPTISPADLLANGTYTVTITDENNCTSSSSIDIIVNELPDAIGNNNSPVCLGDQINFNASGGISYSWEGPNGFTSNDQNPSIPISALDQAGTYTVTVTDDNGCMSTDTTVVIVNDLPIANANNDGPICNGEILNLSASGGITYEWNGPNSFVSQDQNPIITPVSLATAGIYTVTVTDNNGCSQTATTEVVINDLPIITINSNSPVCAESDIEFMATGGVSYEWSGPNSFSSSDQNPIISNASIDNEGTYTVIVTDANGCINSTSTEVIINSLPNATANNDGPVCVGLDINLTASGGISYEWTSDTGFSSSEQNPSLIQVDENDGGVYTVFVTDNNGCVSSATTEVIIFPPVLESASNTSPSCIGDNVTLSVTGNANWNYEWTGPNGFSSQTQNPNINDAQLADGGIYIVTITDLNGCIGTSSTQVGISEFPELQSFITSPVCEGDSVQFQTTFNPNWDYVWTGPFGFTDSIFNPVISSALIENEGSYIVTATNSTGCATQDTLDLVVFDGVMAESYGDTTIFENQSAPIGVTDNSDYTYSWNPTDGLDCGTCPNVVSTPEETTFYEIIVTTTDGCLDTLNIMVAIKDRTDEDLIVPNTITPNDDGYNDTWIIPWLDRFPNNQVVILNRWGDEVFSAKPYNNNFNGNYEGRELPAGTYYFVLLLGEDFRPFKGPLTILRE